LNQDFDIEKDDVKFGFNLHTEINRSSSVMLNMKVPIIINTGKLKINNTGGNVSSA
jgi:flagellar assembly factor FliW